VNKNLKSLLSLSLSLSLSLISQIPLSQKSERKSFTKPKKKKEFEVGTYIRKLIGVSDERWSEGNTNASG
jgi:hypothetical protein